MTLRIKTSLLLALIITFTLGATGVLYLRFLESSLQNSISAGLESVSYTSADAVSRFLQDTYQDSQAVALDLPAEALEDRNITLIESKLKRLLEVFPKFENGIFLLDPSGVLWVDYPAHPEAQGVSFAHREYFRRTMEQQGGVISVPYRSARTGELVITFTSLLRGPSREVLGVLGCSIRLLSPDSLGGIHSVKIGQTGYVYIMDTSRLMLLHPDAERILQRDVPPGVNQLFDAAIEGFEGVGESTNSRGIPMLVSFRHIPGTDWILAAQQMQSEAYAPIREARIRIVFGILIAILGSVLVGVISIRKITAPLRKLRDAAQHYGHQVDEHQSSAQQMKEDLRKELTPMRRGDEIGDLTYAFLDMVDRLGRTLDSLSAAARDWERTFDSVPEAIFILDRDNRILRLNRAGSELLSVRHEEAVGQPCYRLMHGTNHPPAYCPHVRTLATGEVARQEMRDPLSNQIYDLTTTPLMDDQGHLIGTVHVTRDITEKEGLARQLRQAQKMEAIGTLAGGIAHDFNNILSAVMGYTELTLLDLTPESRGRRFLTESLSAANRAKDLVKQILTFTRQQEQERKPVQMGAIVKETLKLLRASLPATIQIHHDIASTGVVLADPTHIHQILMNLCTNAHHAMRDRGGVLEVSLDDIAVDGSAGALLGLKPGPYLELIVSDTGHGMEPSVVERIFDPYFTTKRTGEGTGLGLAVVHGIVKNSAGAIKVFSDPAKGSSFHVYLPRMDLPEAESNESLPRELPSGQERILFVDDEPALVTIAGSMLEELGYSVTVMTRSQGALELVQAEPHSFDLVITDQTMPGITGTSLAQEIFRIRPDMPMILCTGFSQEITGDSASAMGFREFLMKPLAMGDLARAVRSALDGKRGEKG
jgi:PAS domain S-box-containing protein